MFAVTEIVFAHLRMLPAACLRSDVRALLFCADAFAYIKSHIFMKGMHHEHEKNDFHRRRDGTYHAV